MEGAANWKLLPRAAAVVATNPKCFPWVRARPERNDGAHEGYYLTLIYPMSLGLEPCLAASLLATNDI